VGPASNTSFSSCRPYFVPQHDTSSHCRVVCACSLPYWARAGAVTLCALGGVMLVALSDVTPFARGGVICLRTATARAVDWRVCLRIVGIVEVELFAKHETVKFQD